MTDVLPDGRPESSSREPPTQIYLHVRTENNTRYDQSNRQEVYENVNILTDSNKNIDKTEAKYERNTKLDIYAVPNKKRVSHDLYCFTNPNTTIGSEDVYAVPNKSIKSSQRDRKKELGAIRGKDYENIDSKPEVLGNRSNTEDYELFEPPENSQSMMRKDSTVLIENEIYVSATDV